MKSIFSLVMFSFIVLSCVEVEERDRANGMTNTSTDSIEERDENNSDIDSNDLGSNDLGGDGGDDDVGGDDADLNPFGGQATEAGTEINDPAGMDFEIDMMGGYGGEITGGEITGGEITGGEMTGGEITGGEITGGEMTGGEIMGGESMGGEQIGGTLGGGEVIGGMDMGGLQSGGEVIGGLQGGINGGYENTDDCIEICAARELRCNAVEFPLDDCVGSCVNSSYLDELVDPSITEEYLNDSFECRIAHISRLALDIPTDDVERLCASSSDKGGVDCQNWDDRVSLGGDQDSASLRINSTAEQDGLIMLQMTERRWVSILGYDGGICLSQNPQMTLYSLTIQGDLVPIVYVNDVSDVDLCVHLLMELDEGFYVLAFSDVDPISLIDLAVEISVVEERGELEECLVDHRMIAPCTTPLRCLPQVDGSLSNGVCTQPPAQATINGDCVPIYEQCPSQSFCLAPSEINSGICTRLPTSIGDACDPVVARCPNELRCSEILRYCVQPQCGDGLIDEGEQCDGEYLDGCTNECRFVTALPVYEEGVRSQLLGQLNDRSLRWSAPDTSCTFTPNSASQQRYSIRTIDNQSNIPITVNVIGDWDEGLRLFAYHDFLPQNSTSGCAWLDASVVLTSQSIGPIVIEPNASLYLVISDEQPSNSNRDFTLDISVVGCGNGEIEGEELCDDGVNNGDLGQCSNECERLTQCGNGQREAEEQCDDGNLVNNDGCTTQCEINAVNLPLLNIPALGTSTTQTILIDEQRSQWMAPSGVLGCNTVSEELNYYYGVALTNSTDFTQKIRVSVTLNSPLDVAILHQYQLPFIPFDPLEGCMNEINLFGAEEELIINLAPSESTGIIITSTYGLALQDAVQFTVETVRAPALTQCMLTSPNKYVVRNGDMVNLATRITDSSNSIYVELGVGPIDVRPDSSFWSWTPVQNPTTIDEDVYQYDASYQITEYGVKRVLMRASTDQQFWKYCDTEGGKTEIDLLAEIPTVVSVNDNQNYVVINEIDAANTADEQREFLELYNTGTTPVLLDRLQLELFDATSSAPYVQISLADISPWVDVDQRIVIGTERVLRALPPELNILQKRLNVPLPNLEGGARLLLLNEFGEVQKVLDSMSYGVMIDACTEGAYPAASDDESIVSGFSISRCPDGVDQQLNDLDFKRVDQPSPGGVNPCGNILVP